MDCYNVAKEYGIPIIAEFAQTGLVPRFPTAVLASSLAIIAVLIWLLGLMLDGIAKSRRESSRLTYLALQAPPYQAPRGQAGPAGGRGVDAHGSDARAYDRVPVRRAEPDAGH